MGGKDPEDKMDKPVAATERFAVLRIVAIYAIVGGLWIYLSDTVLGWLIHDSAIMTRIAVFKGLLFIILTASLLYFLISRYISRLAESNRLIQASQEELRRSEEDLKSVLELMPVGVSWSNDDGKIQYVNRSFVEHFGYSLDDIPTVAQWFERAYPDPTYRRSVADSWDTDIAAAHELGIPVPPREVKVASKDGTLRHLIISTQLARNRTIVIFTDITEQENSRAELIKTQKLESLGVLAGGIAHDFNNVLTGILGNISYAQMFLDASHKSAKALHEAERASKRAAELAHQLLTFAKGGLPITKAVSAGHLLEESVSLVLRGSNVKGVLEISDDVRAIKVDAGQISQAFNNIIINAVQAMPGGGTITIRAENVALNGKNRQGLASGNYVAFSFTDEGCGIPPNDQKRVFDPYFTTKSGGSGLGLASVYSIISKHGGYVGIHSRVGTGTTFEIYLPSCNEIVSPDVMDMVTPQPAPYGNSSVLVMDDEEIIRDLTRDMLAELGYRVTTCSDGRDAISLYTAAKAAGTPFSVVIMDLTIPGGVGGKEAAQQILAIDPEARLIVSSGYSNDPVVAEYTKHGFCATMVKPYKITEVARILGQCVSPSPAGRV